MPVSFDRTIGSYTGAHFDIDATVSLLGQGGNVLKSEPVIGVYATSGFFPANFLINWKEVHELQARIKLSYRLSVGGLGAVDMEEVGSGSNDIVQPWRVSYGAKGMQFLPLAWRQSGQQTRYGDPTVLVDLVPEATDELDAVTFFLTIRLGVQVDLDEDTELQGSYLPYWQNAIKVAHSEDIPIRIVCISQNRPEPKASVPSYLLSHFVRFEPEKQAQVTIPELDKIETNWVKPLKREMPALAEAVEAGVCPVELWGHASTTGTGKDNRDLSVKRIGAVKEAIRDNFNHSTAIFFIDQPKGEESATERGAVARERRVEIRIPNWAADMYANYGM